MSALFVSESLALQKLGPIAGLSSNNPIISKLKMQSESMASLLNTSLWDDETGIYRQRDATANKSRGLSPVLSPTSFYPMLAGIPSVSQAERMVANHLTNASEFCVDPGSAVYESSAERCLE